MTGKTFVSIPSLLSLNSKAIGYATEKPFSQMELFQLLMMLAFIILLFSFMVFTHTGIIEVTSNDRLNL